MPGIGCNHCHTRSVSWNRMPSQSRQVRTINCCLKFKFECVSCSICKRDWRPAISFYSRCENPGLVIRLGEADLWNRAPFPFSSDNSADISLTGNPNNAMVDVHKARRQSRSSEGQCELPGWGNVKNPKDWEVIDRLNETLDASSL